MGSDLLAFRNAVRGLFQKYQTPLHVIFKFLVFFLAYSRLVSELPYNATLSGGLFKLAFGVMGAVLPPLFSIFVLILVALYEIYSASLFLAAITLVLFVVLYCFGARFSGKFAYALVAIPLLWKYNLQFFVPILLGMTATPFGIFPTAVGVAAYYILIVVKEFALKPSVKSADEILEFYVEFMNRLRDCKEMLLCIALFCFIVCVMYGVRHLKFSFCFEVTIALGGILMIAGFAVLNRRFDTDFSMEDVVFGTLVSLFTTYVLQFFRMALNYKAVENVQFEDDDYYYYVQAVPKLKDRFTKKPVSEKKSRKAEKEETADKTPGFFSRFKKKGLSGLENEEEAKDILDSVKEDTGEFSDELLEEALDATDEDMGNAVYKAVFAAKGQKDKKPEEEQ